MARISTGSDMQIILTQLINKGSVSCISVPIMHGFRTRVSELRNTYNITLEAVKRNGVKANGNAYYYFEHFLKEESVNDAKILLERLKKK